jgi:hypothetical protein
MNVLKSYDHYRDIVRMLRTLDLGEFSATYRSLRTLLTHLRHSTQTPLVFSTPPGQTTVPENPNHSGGSTSSSSSTESKAEPYSQNFMTKFMDATLTTMVEFMGDLEWANPETKAHLSEQYFIV